MRKLLRILLGICGVLVICLCISTIMFFWAEIQFPKHVEDLRMQTIHLLGSLKVGEPVYRFTLPEDFDFDFKFYRSPSKSRERCLTASYISRRKTMEVYGSRRITQEIQVGDIGPWLKENFDLIKDCNKMTVQIKSWQTGSFHWGAMTAYYSPEGIVTSHGDLGFYGRTKFAD
jgi:hypothetical protein